MDRYFEKISYEQFLKDGCGNKEDYEELVLPQRKTRFSAAYDFIALKDMEIKPGETIKIPSGYKANMQDDEALLIAVRSSMGYNYNVRLCNQIAIIDKDYYNNPNNEGHIFIALKNEGDMLYKIKKGAGYAQGMFIKYLTCGDEIKETRTGGLGSTNRKEEENGK